MAEFLANLTNGQIDEKGIFRLVGTLLTQTGVVQSGAMQVAAQGSPDMTVKVAGGATGHDIVFITAAGDTYHGWNTADKNVTISANGTGVTKKDAIVAYADLAAGISTSNNPGALKFVAVRGSGTNTAPNSGQIETAIGAANPYHVLAHVTVANGASSINSGNIADQRTRAYVDGERVQLEDASVTSRRLKPTADVLAATGNLSLTTTVQDVPGLTATIAPEVPSTVIVTGTIHIDGNGTAASGDLCIGTLVVDGVAQSAQIIGRFDSAVDRGNYSVSWKFNLTAGSHTFKIRAQNNLGSRGQVSVLHSTMSYLVISQ